MIVILHDNDAWIAPYEAELKQAGVPYQLWDLEHVSVDLASVPPEAVYLNRASPSSHTRGKRFAMENALAIVTWLEAHGRTVFNGSAATRFEMSKVLGETQMQLHGVATPRTLFASGREALKETIATAPFAAPFLLKPSRGGSGAGVRRFSSVEAAHAYVDSADFEEPLDGIMLVQEFIESPEEALYRLEFVDGRFKYAVRVDTSSTFAADSGAAGSNCAADSCNVPSRAASAAATAAAPAAAAASASASAEVESLEDLAALGDGLTLLKFGASWCKACKSIAGAVSEIAAATPDLTVAEVDVDEADEEVVDQFGVSSIPAFVVLNGSEVVGEYRGSNEAQLREELARHIALPEKTTATAAAAAAPAPAPVVAAPAPTSTAEVAEVESLEELEALGDGLTLLKFGASWCKACKSIAGAVSEIAAATPELTVAEVDVDEADEDVVDQFSVSSIPAFIVLNGGEVVGEYRGSNEEQLREELARHIALPEKATATAAPAPAPAPVAAAPAPTTTAEVAEVESLEELEALGDGLTLLKFGASWCKACKSIAGAVSEIAAATPELTVAEVDVDEADEEVVDQFSVSSIPAFIVLDGGKVVGEYRGSNEAQLREELARHVETPEAATEAPKEIANCPLKASADKFQILPAFSHRVIRGIEAMLAANGSSVAGVEIVLDASGEAFVIDANVLNTNYNSRAEAAAGVEQGGAAAVVAMLLRQHAEQFGALSLGERLQQRAAAVTSASTSSTPSSALGLGKWNACCACEFSRLPDRLLLASVLPLLEDADAASMSAVSMRWHFIARDSLDAARVGRRPLPVGELLPSLSAVSAALRVSRVLSVDSSVSSVGSSVGSSVEDASADADVEVERLPAIEATA